MNNIDILTNNLPFSIYFADKIIVMNYINQFVRRQDRLLEETAAIALLRNGEYGVLSMQAEETGVYGIPVNYVWDGKNFIYIHCAPEGKKMRCLEKCDQVSFCVVGKTHILPNKFTTEYESIVLHCEAHIRLFPEERMHALEMILDKYSPEDKVIGLEYAKKSFHRTEVIRLDIITMSGKCKNVIV